LDENAWSELASGNLDESRRQHALDHLDVCARCRHVAALAASGQSQPAQASLLLERGATLSHYVVQEILGVGAMGIVYSARDVALERVVALKLLRSDGGEGGRARLLREAKTAATLSHPNVVVVHEVGTFEGHVFIAMERVDGGSLAEWLTAPREPREILAAFRQAGHGLAAAHEAGLIHRDFKPDNVLMGRDGRARVADFGVACVSGDAAVVSHDPRSTELDLGALSLTPTGALAGTPAYMAPELFQAHPADARSDQFAFGVSLYQGLFGHRPFARSSCLEKSIRVPVLGGYRRIRPILQKALSFEPSLRFPDMRTLLRELDAALDPPVSSSARTGTTLAFAFMPLVIASVAVAADDASQRSATAPTWAEKDETSGAFCHAVEARTRSAALSGEPGRPAGADVWTETQRAAIHDAMTASGLPYAEDTFHRVVDVLSERATEWTRGAVALCHEAREPETVVVRRVQCFEERLAELEAVVGVLEQTDRVAIEHAVSAARALPSMETCTAIDDALPDAPLPGDLEVRARVLALEQELRIVDTLRALGQVDPAQQRAASALAQVETLGFAPLTAEALLVAGDVEVARGGDLAGADAILRRATVAAEAAGVARTTAKAWIHWATLASDRADYRAADERFDFAAAWVDRLHDDGSIRGELLLREGKRRLDGGDYEEAARLLGAARSVLQAAGSDLSIDAVKCLGIVADGTQRHDAARSLYGQALERYEETFGPNHPAVANVLGDLGMMASDDGNFAEGVPLLERALAIDEGALGKEHQGTVDRACNLALVYLAIDREKEAFALADPAVHAAEKAYGPDSPEVAYCLNAVAIALVSLHRPTDAIGPATRELTLRSRPGVAPLLLAEARTDLGLALVGSGRDLARGRSLLQQAREAFVAAQRMNRVPEIDRALSRPRLRF
jgi:tetratricopeptide (TPR) repeat protein